MKKEEVTRTQAQKHTRSEKGRRMCHFENAKSNHLQRRAVGWFGSLPPLISVLKNGIMPSNML